jgi:hypothetical protein
VEELRLQPLLPAGALVDQRLAQPHTRTQLQDLRRRDPRLRQLARREQPQQQIAVGPVGLRAPLAPALTRRLGRVSEMGAMPRPLDLLDHEPPARRPLERETHLVDTVEPRQPLPHRFPGRGSDPPS